MKFWSFVSEHIAEIALIAIVIFAIFSLPISFLCKRPATTQCNITIDSTQVLNVKLVNDSSYVVR